MDILIADRRSMVRYALSTLLKKHSGWVVIGIAENTQGLFSILTNHKPDVLLLDWTLPGSQSTEIIQAIRYTHPDLRIIVMSADPDIRGKAISLGADYFVSKIESPSVLITAIKSCERRIVQDKPLFTSNQLENNLL
jgi:DNA-binding NarL/FixJ family response regulator